MTGCKAGSGTKRENQPAHAATVAGLIGNVMDAGNTGTIGFCLLCTYTTVLRTYRHYKPEVLGGPVGWADRLPFSHLL